MSSEEIGTVEELRRSIDQIDHKLVELLNERAKVSIHIGKSKKTDPKNEENTQVYIPGREKQVLEKVAKLNHGPLATESIQAIYREIMSASISLQKTVTIAYLGPPGTYTHQAAVTRFGDSVNFVEMRTISDVFLAVEKKHCTYGVVPFENSTFGTVVSCIDQFISSNLKIRAETYLEIRHSILSNCVKGSIRKIFSHPEAFGQCKKWIENNMRGVELISVSSTAYAAKVAQNEPNSAAICSEVCADLYGMNVLETNIQDEKGNTTRFFILGHECDSSTKEDKTLIMFTVDHRQPGALCDALSVFKNEEINLTKIDSRPVPSKKWHYYFFIEFEGHFTDERVARSLNEIKKFCIDIKVLGSYPNFRNKEHQ